MKFLLIHGRDDPEQKMDSWGYNGPELEEVKYIHSVYGNLTIGFKTKEAANKAHKHTGWPYFDDAVLEITFFEDMVLCRTGDGKSQYYGDWEIQEDD